MCGRFTFMCMRTYVRLYAQLRMRPYTRMYVHAHVLTAFWEPADAAFIRASATPSSTPKRSIFVSVLVWLSVSVSVHVLGVDVSASASVDVGDSELECRCSVTVLNPQSSAPCLKAVGRPSETDVVKVKDGVIHLRSSIRKRTRGWRDGLTLKAMQGHAPNLDPIATPRMRTQNAHTFINAGMCTFWRACIGSAWL